jgi:type VI secretion system protein ImpE
VTPQSALADGRLTEALALQGGIAEAGEPTALLLLFELQLLANRTRDAWETLHRIDSADADWPTARRWFRRLVRAALRRRRGRAPRFPGEPPRHARYRLRARDATRALDAIDRADAASPHLVGHVDGREFDGLRDADDRFASVLEAFIGPNYCWLPFEQIARIEIAPANRILDGAYRPARIRLATGDELAAVLPLVYPDGEEDWQRLGLDTDIEPTDGGPPRCVGAKLLLVGEEELPLGEIRQLDIRPWT